MHTAGKNRTEAANTAIMGTAVASRKSAQELLDRNEDILHTLIGLAKLRAGRSITDVEEQLAAEAFENLTELAGQLPPKVLLQQKHDMEVFVRTARTLGMLPQRSDLPPPPPEPEPQMDQTGEDLFEPPHGGTPISKPVAAVDMLFQQGSAEALTSVGYQAPPRPAPSPAAASPSPAPASSLASGAGAGRGAGAEGTSKPAAAAPPPGPGPEVKGGGKVAEAADVAKKGLRADEDKGRITMLELSGKPPPGCDVFALKEFHKLADLSGVAFYKRCDVIDSDDASKTFHFNVEDVSHGAGFNLGVTGSDGTPLISYSEMSAFYQLPDGSKWSQHADFLDLDDLKELAKTKGKGFKKVLHPEFWHPFELIRKAGWSHTKLKEIEFENWVYRGKKFYAENIHKGGEAPAGGPESYFYRTIFDPQRWQVIEHLDE